MFHNYYYLLCYNIAGGFKNEVRLANDFNGLSLASRNQFAKLCFGALVETVAVVAVGAQ